VTALHMIEPRADRPIAITLGADKAYDAEDLVNELRPINVRSHVAQNTIRLQLCDRGANDLARRLCRQPAHSQADRGGIRLNEDGRGKRRPGTVAVIASRGLLLPAASYNLVRLPKLIAEAG